MNVYGEFSEVYDTFMEDAPYEPWQELLTTRYALSSASLVDLGCGTGRLSVELARAGATVTGIDLSEDMLSRAGERAFRERANLSFLCQDMRDFRISNRVDMVISTCDALNYLLTEEDLVQAFCCVRKALKDDGSFLFDVIGKARFESLAAGTWHEIKEDEVLLYETSIGEHDQISYAVHAFIEEEDGRYRRIEEEHEQRFYPLTTLEALLGKAGFRVDEVLGDFGNSDSRSAHRLICIAKPYES